MSAGGAGAIGPVSARYAAQIRELLHAQALQRLVADQEAARASAEAARAAQAEGKPEHDPKPADAPPAKQPDPATADTPHIIDIQA